MLCLKGDICHLFAWMTLARVARLTKVVVSHICCIPVNNTQVVGAWSGNAVSAITGRSIQETLSFYSDVRLKPETRQESPGCLCPSRVEGTFVKWAVDMLTLVPSQQSRPHQQKPITLQLLHLYIFHRFVFVVNVRRLLQRILSFIWSMFVLCFVRWGCAPRFAVAKSFTCDGIHSRDWCSSVDKVKFESRQHLINFGQPCSRI